jgi:hypothetical protein
MSDLRTFGGAPKETPGESAPHSKPTLSGGGGLPSKSEAEILEDLRLMQTNFLFIYGDHQAGKSAICASLIYHLMTSHDLGSFDGRSHHGPGSNVFINRAVESIRSKRFLVRTPLETVTLAGGRFTPKNRQFRAIPITFMEMAGEDLMQLVAPPGAGRFPKEIDLYLKDKSLNIFFVLVIRHQDAIASKDLNLSNFIDYLREKDSRFKNSRILLLVSQWDSYRRGRDVKTFVEEFLPVTAAALHHSRNAIATYSVGEITSVEDAPYIASLNNNSPRILMRWLYRTITGTDLLRESIFKRFLNIITR